MKTSRIAALAAAMLVIFPSTATRLSAQTPGDPSIPVGGLIAFPTIVQAGTHPVLTWGIDYPRFIRDIVTINSGGTIVPGEDVDIEIRVINSTGQATTISNGASGAGSSSAVTVTFNPGGTSVDITSSKDLSNVVLGFSDGTHYKFDNLSGHTATFAGIGPNEGKTITTVWVKSGSYMSGDGPGYGYRFDAPAGSGGMLDAQIRADGASVWSRYFYDNPHTINPTSVVFTQHVRAGRPIDFRARRHTGSAWLGYRSTGTSTANVAVLVDGQSLPSHIPALQQQRLKEFLVPYVDSSGVVRIGPKDVLFLFELTETNTSSPDFTMQDLAVLTTFATESKSAKVKNNNGHGNNIDGVDSSNPGNAPFIPYDSDPNFDDEGHGGGAYPSLH